MQGSKAVGAALCAVAVLAVVSAGSALAGEQQRSCDKSKADKARCETDSLYCPEEGAPCEARATVTAVSSTKGVKGFVNLRSLRSGHRADNCVARTKKRCTARATVTVKPGDTADAACRAVSVKGDNATLHCKFVLG